jgi:hypothetical protein
VLAQAAEIATGLTATVFGPAAGRCALSEIVVGSNGKEEVGRLMTECLMDVSDSKSGLLKTTCGIWRWKMLKNLTSAFVVCVGHSFSV